MHTSPSNVPSPGAAAACPHSPYCQPSQAALRRYGYTDALRTRWLHFGPINRARTPLAIHGSAIPEIDPPDTIRTRSEHAAFVGFHLDLLVTVSRPQPGRSPSLIDTPDGPLKCWPILAYAWRRPELAYAQWFIRSDGTVDIGHRFPGGRSTSAAIDEARRCEALIHGRRPIARRVPVSLDPQSVAIVGRAEQIRRARPSLTWAKIAAEVGVTERTLYNYRRALGKLDDDDDDFQARLGSIITRVGRLIDVTEARIQQRSRHATPS